MAADLHPRLRELPGIDVPPSGLTPELVASLNLPGVKTFVAELMALVATKCNANCEATEDARAIGA